MTRPRHASLSREPSMFTTTTHDAAGGHHFPEEVDTARMHSLRDPVCHGLEELPGAKAKRARVARHLAPQRDPLTTQPAPYLGDSMPAVLADAAGFGVDRDSNSEEVDPASPLFHHLSQGLALTTGSALGSTPPNTAACLAAFLVPNKAHLTAGARAWSKHAHRSQPIPAPSSPHDEPIHAADSQSRAAGEEPDPGIDLKKTNKEQEIRMREKSDGWWGRPSGPVTGINERALALFWKVVGGATWRNLHWLPHRVLVYEVRVEEGYGMRWSQDQSALFGEDGLLRCKEDREGAEAVLKPWIFRGFVEPMMENGHELGWRHPV